MKSALEILMSEGYEFKDSLIYRASTCHHGQRGGKGARYHTILADASLMCLDKGNVSEIDNFLLSFPYWDS